MFPSTCGVALLGLLAATPSGAAPASATAIELRAVELPGLRLKLPPWTVAKTAQDWFVGAHEVRGPAKLPQLVQVQWFVSDEPLSDKTLQAMWAQVAGDRLRRWGKRLSACGQKAETYYSELDDDGHRIWMSAWSFGGRQIMIMSTDPSRPGSKPELHAAILASIECLPRPEGVAPVFPLFEAPADSESEETGSGRAVLLPDEDVLFFAPGNSDPSLADKMVKHDELRHKALGLLLSEMELEGKFEQAPRLQVTADGSKQRVWLGTTRDEEGSMPLLFAVWACASPPRAFVALYMGSDAERGLELLRSARCP